MDSKKLGMFAAAALTVLATQASAEGKKEAKPTAVKATGEAQCFGSCQPSCKGQVKTDIKDKAACTAAKGTWATKAEYEAKEGKGGEHKH